MTRSDIKDSVGRRRLDQTSKLWRMLKTTADDSKLGVAWKTLRN
uniref:Uncharacterized protein n=1 Tax=Cucumis melo TaxID=3656 RepID=A0A9I9EFK8_CUCME